MLFVAAYVLSVATHEKKSERRRTAKIESLELNRHPSCTDGVIERAAYEMSSNERANDAFAFPRLATRALSALPSPANGLSDSSILKCALLCSFDNCFDFFRDLFCWHTPFLFEEKCYVAYPAFHSLQLRQQSDRSPRRSDLDMALSEDAQTSRSSARFGQLSTNSFFARNTANPKRVRHIEGRRSRRRKSGDASLLA